MKKALMGLILMAVTFPATGLAESLDDLAARLNTPEKIEAFMKSELQYRTDSDFTVFGVDEYWESAEELVYLKKGDCEDFSEFAREMLVRNGFKAVLFEGMWEGNAHVVTVFHDKTGKIFVFNFDGLKQVRAKTIAELVDSISPGLGYGWDGAAVMRREGSSGIISVKFTRARAKETPVSDLF